jgi:site-specific DNA recombinase
MSIRRRAVIYARFSSDRQNERSIDDQVALCRELLDRNGWRLTAIYEDHAVSAATVHRPEFARMLGDAEARRFDLIVAEDIDRLARGEGDAPKLRQRCEFLGIEIHTCTDGHVTKLHAGLKGLMGSLFLDNLIAHTKRGMAGVVREGRYAGGRAYGYRKVADKKGELEIVDAEATVVQRIFNDYVSGKSPRAIAGALNAEGVKPPRGARWNASTINGSGQRGNGILRNELYIGRIVWNKIRMVKDPDTGRRLSRPNTPDKFQVVEAPTLAIVDAKVFAAARERKTTRAAVPFQRQQAPRRPLSGILRCATCGGGLSRVGQGGTGRLRMQCSTYRESGVCKNKRIYYVDAIEQEVLGCLKRELVHPRVIETYIAEYNAERRRLAGKRDTRRAQRERRQGEVARELARAVEAILKGLVDPETLRAPIRALEAERDRLAAGAAAEATAGGTLTLHPTTVARYLDEVSRLHELLVEGNGMVAGVNAEAIAIVRSLIREVVVHPTDGGFEVEIIGDLAALTGEMRIFPNCSRSARKAVAGAGFEPATSGL